MRITMRWLSIGTLLIVVILSYSVAPGRLPGSAQASTKNISLILPDISKFRVNYHVLQNSSPLTGIIALENASQAKIKVVHLLVDYFDEKDRRVGTIQYFGKTAEPFDVLEQDHPFFENFFGKAIGEHEVFYLRGTNLVTSISNISYARVSRVFVLPDDTGRGFSAIPYHVDPILREIPERISFDLPKAKTHPTLLVGLEIGLNGGVNKAEILEPAPVGESMSKEVANQIKNWVFYPAQVSGYAAVSRLTLLISFREDGVPPSETFALPSNKSATEFVVVEFVRTKEKCDSWEVFYGGFPVNRTLGKMRIFRSD